MKKMIMILLILSIVVSGVGCTQKTEPVNNDAPAAEEKLDYPKSPIEMIIPFGEGSASDIFARKFAAIMSQSIPQPIQPVNKDGSGGLVGMVHAAQQKNDGYTILGVTPSHVIADALETSPQVKLMEHFEPLARIQSDIYVLAVPEQSKFKNIEEILAYGKDKEVTFAGVSPGGLDDLTLSALADATGMKIKFIPYKSGSEVKSAVLGGEVDIYLDKMISAIKFIESGKVKPVLVLNDKRVDRIDQLKNTPTTVELGFDVTIGSWRGFVVKKGTPEPIKKYLMEEMKKAYETNEYKEFAAQNLADLRDGFLDADEFRKQWEEEYKIFEEIAKKVGLK